MTLSINYFVAFVKLSSVISAALAAPNCVWNYMFQCQTVNQDSSYIVGCDVINVVRTFSLKGHFKTYLQTFLSRVRHTPSYQTEVCCGRIITQCVLLALCEILSHKSFYCVHIELQTGLKNTKMIKMHWIFPQGSWLYNTKSNSFHYL